MVLQGEALFDALTDLGAATEGATLEGEAAGAEAEPEQREGERRAKRPGEHPEGLPADADGEHPEDGEQARKLPGTHGLSPSAERAGAAGHRHHAEHFFEDGGGGDATHTGGRRDDDAVAEGGPDERLDVVGLDEIAATQRGEGLGGVEESEGAARAGAEVDVLVAAGGGDDGDDVFANLALDAH